MLGILLGRAILLGAAPLQRRYSEMPKKLTPLDRAYQTIRDLRNELHEERTTAQLALRERNRALERERDDAVAKTDSATRELAAYALAFSALVSLWHVIGTKE